MWQEQTGNSWRNQTETTGTNKQITFYQLQNLEHKNKRITTHDWP